MSYFTFKTHQEYARPSITAGGGVFGPSAAGFRGLGRIFQTSYDHGHRHSVNIPGLRGFGACAPCATQGMGVVGGSTSGGVTMASSGTSSGLTPDTVCDGFSAAHVEADIKKFADQQALVNKNCANDTMPSGIDTTCDATRAQQGAANAASGRAMHAIQLALNALGFPVAVDSILGSETKSQMAAWGRSVGTDTFASRTFLQKMESELRSKCGGGGGALGLSPTAMVLGAAGLIGLVVLARRKS